MQATLPKQYEQKPLVIDEGKTVYMVPWALWVDRDKNLWLCTNYTAHETKGGTVEMAVTKQNGAILVDLRGINHQFEPNPLHHGRDYIPVAQVLS